MHRDQGSVVSQEGQHEVCILRKGGLIQEMGNSACWLGYRETQQGAGNPPPPNTHTHKLPKQVKKNSVKPLPNVTEHREATERAVLSMELIHDPRRGQVGGDTGSSMRLFIKGGEEGEDIAAPKVSCTRARRELFHQGPQWFHLVFKKLSVKKTKSLGLPW